MTRLERETLARIRERLAIFDPGASEKLAALLPELAALLEAAEGAMQ